MKKEYPLISVIIPAYNCGHFIGAAIESVLRQTYPEEFMEVIVVDDGSTDNTADILRRFGERIIRIHQENRGIASARNRGIAVAKGEVVTFIDADDLWHADRLEKVVNAFLKNERTGIVYHPIELLDSDGHIVCENFLGALGYCEGLRGDVTRDIITGRIFCGGSSFAFRKAILKKVFPLPEDIKRGVDYYMTVLASCDSIAEYIPEVLGAYRSRRGNISMFAGFTDVRELSTIYGDFAHTHLTLLEKLDNCRHLRNNSRATRILRKIQIREAIFFHILRGERYDAVKKMPTLFRKNNGLCDLSNALAIAVITLFLPRSVLYRVLKLNAAMNKMKLSSGKKHLKSEGET